jgi:hypothetical protein
MMVTAGPFAIAEAWEKFSRPTIFKYWSLMWLLAWFRTTIMLVTDQYTILELFAHAVIIALVGFRLAYMLRQDSWI